MIVFCYIHLFRYKKVYVHLCDSSGQSERILLYLLQWFIPEEIPKPPVEPNTVVSVKPEVTTSNSANSYSTIIDNKTTKNDKVTTQITPEKQTTSEKQAAPEKQTTSETQLTPEKQTSSDKQTTSEAPNNKTSIITTPPTTENKSTPLDKENKTTTEQPLKPAEDAKTADTTNTADASKTVVTSSR